jgi:predicted DNA-binding ribbon-helix-helix protein
VLFYFSTMYKRKTEFASIKLTRPFVIWLKREAARRGLHMYQLVEELASHGGSRPWTRSSST